MKFKFLLIVLSVFIVSCASGPSKKYQVGIADTNIPIIIGSVSVWSKGTGMGTGIDFRNEDTGEYIPYNGAKSFSLRLKPGNYSVHSIGSRQGGLGSKDVSLKFTVTNQPLQYIGTIVKSFHINNGFEANGKEPFVKREYGLWEPIFIGGAETRKAGEVTSPYTEILVFDNQSNVLANFYKEYPTFSTVKVSNSLLY